MPQETASGAGIPPDRKRASSPARSGHVSASAVWNSDLRKVVLTDQVLFHAQLQKMGFGEGEALIVRVEREADAIEHRQYKHLFGHVFEPVSESSGHTTGELCLMAKARFLPDDGRTSLTQLTRDEFAAFIQATEIWLREECPEAFVLQDAERGVA